MMQKFIVFFCLFLAVNCARFRLGKELYNVEDYESRKNGAVQTKWFKQELDHFQTQDTRTWKQRYFEISKYDSPEGPVFLEISGEGPMNAEKFEISFMADNLTREFKALSFQLEHRFYGKSQPFDDWSTEHFQYLTSEQALADLANFIQTMNVERNLKDRKWIIFGGSYAGALSAWMRLKYPHLVTGSIASSAPVQAQLDFPEYMEVVYQSLGDECSENVRTAFSSLSKLSENSKGIDYIKKLFNVCSLSTTNNKTFKNFMSNIIDLFAGVVQYNEDNKKGNNVTINHICGVMNDDTQTINVEKLARVYKLINREDDKECNDVSYWKEVQELRNVTIDFQSSSRQWIYQTCNEFGYYQTTSSKLQPFPNVLDLNFFTDLCVDVYGSKFNMNYIQTAVDRTNINYGGRNLKADNVFLINGSIDPWHALSVTPLHGYSYKNTSSYYIIGTAHCADMYQPSPNDRPELVKAREMIAERIKVFLQ